MLDNFEVIFFTAVFIVPGYIIFITLQSLVPRSKLSIADATLKFLTATLIHYILWSWLIYLMFNTELYGERPLLFYFLTVFIIVVSPCLLGLLLAKLSYKKVVIRALQLLRYNPINPIPTAWDYIFSSLPTKSWVIVSLKDGKVFYGKFSTNSFASSDSSERDVYIEDVYILNENKEWIKRDRNNGVLILSDEIQTIEFFNN